LHIGQTDLDPRTARKLLPPGSVLGLSIGSQEEASRLLDLSKDEEGTLVDYVGIGAVWRTTSKDVSKKVMLGPEGVGKILDLLHDGSGGSIKSVAIGESSLFSPHNPESHQAFSLQPYCDDVEVLIPLRLSSLDL
jgi:thiamine-phosphate diphosphorylase/hydroxyethylthiazole kinase